MAVDFLSNGFTLTCLSTDTKPAVVPKATFLALETDTGKLFFTVNSGGTWTLTSGGLGEANTASNVGSGQGVWKAKTGVDLSFRSLTATSSKIALANNTNDIGIDVTEANLTLSNMIGPLSVAKGGTGAATLTGVLKGSGTSAITAAAQLAVADGGTGAATLTGVLKGNGTSAVTAAALLAVADGGTGAGTLTGILKGNGTSAFTALTDPLPIANGGTSGATAAAGYDALSSMTTLGDIQYGGASGTRTRLAGNLTGSKKFLTQQGTGAASAAPTWAVPPVFPSSGRKWGIVIPLVAPGASAVAGQVGLLANSGCSLTGTTGTSNTYANGGTWTTQAAASNPSVSGFRFTNNFTYRGWNTRLKFKFKMDSLTASKSVMGLKVSAPQTSNDDPANASSMAAIGFSSTVDATHWIAWTNNGTALRATDATVTAITADTNFHTCEIVAVDGSSKFTYSIDEAAPVDMVSTIPAQQTQLTISFSIATTEAVVKNLDIAWIEIEHDK